MKNCFFSPPNLFLRVYLAARAGADSEFKKITGRTDDVAISPRSKRSDNQVGTTTFVLAKQVLFFYFFTGRTDDVAISPRSVRSENQVGTTTFVLSKASTF